MRFVRKLSNTLKGLLRAWRNTHRGTLAMVGALVLLIMAASGLGRLPPSVADIVEVNHVMRDNGEFIQVCELDWIVDDRSYHYQTGF